MSYLDIVVDEFDRLAREFKSTKSIALLNRFALARGWDGAGDVREFLSLYLNEELTGAIAEHFNEELTRSPELPEKKESLDDEWPLYLPD